MGHVARRRCCALVTLRKAPVLLSSVSHCGQPSALLGRRGTRNNALASCPCASSRVRPLLPPQEVSVHHPGLTEAETGLANPVCVPEK